MDEYISKTISENPNMQKSFHLYLANDSTEIIHSYAKTKKAIEEDFPVILTTQVMLCKTSLIERGYRIFIYPKIGERFEVTLGACECTDRELRMCHNLPNMLISGAFYRDGMVLF